jgi:hypothetical protein
MRSGEHIGWFLETDRWPLRSEEHFGQLSIVEPRSTKLRRAIRGAARQRQDSRSNPTPHWFPASGLRRAPRRGAGEAWSRARSSLMLIVSAPSGSEELQGHRRVARRSVDLSGHRRPATSMLRRAQRRKSSVLVKAHTWTSCASGMHRRAPRNPMSSPSSTVRTMKNPLASR